MNFEQRVTRIFFKYISKFPPLFLTSSSVCLDLSSVPSIPMHTHLPIYLIFSLRYRQALRSIKKNVPASGRGSTMEFWRDRLIHAIHLWTRTNKHRAVSYSPRIPSTITAITRTTFPIHPTHSAVRCHRGLGGPVRANVW